jgi:hypothetical protein
VLPALLDDQLKSLPVAGARSKQQLPIHSHLWRGRSDQ